MTDKTGKHVVYFDEYSIAHDALVTADWGKPNDGPVNLVYVVTDPAYVDKYGQQTKHPSSVAYIGSFGYEKLMANCWCHKDEYETKYKNQKPQRP